MVKAVLEQGDGAAQANGSVLKEPTMDLVHVARAIVQMAGLPLDANVLFMTIMATKMPFVGRGCRNQRFLNFMSGLAFLITDRIFLKTSLFVRQNR